MLKYFLMVLIFKCYILYIAHTNKNTNSWFISLKSIFFHSDFQCVTILVLKFPQTLASFGAKFRGKSVQSNYFPFEFCFTLSDKPIDFALTKLRPSESLLFSAAFGNLKKWEDFPLFSKFCWKYWSFAWNYNCIIKIILSWNRAVKFNTKHNFAIIFIAILRTWSPISECPLIAHTSKPSGYIVISI